MSKAKILRVAFWVIAAVAAVVIIFMGVNLVQVIANPITLDQLQPQVGSTVIYDCNGKEYTRLGTGIEKSTRSESFPDTVKYSVISIEDHRFYKHHGVDVIRTGKAILDTVSNGKFGAGGSTITQQLVKNATGDRSIAISRKVREWFYAIQLEMRYSKEEILTHYLNIVYMGKGLYGMTDAAKYYFGCELNELSINQAAFLAGIIKSPETYVKDLEKGNTRKNTVLSYMYKYGVISEQTCSDHSAKAVSINTKSRNNVQDWYVDSVVTELADLVERQYSLDSEEALQMVYQGGFKVYSTVDPDVQEAIENEYESISGIQSAIVILSKDGKVRGVVGGTGKKSGDLLFNRALSAKRQPGSSIKPLAVYAPCFEQGVVDNTVIVNDQYLNYNGWTPGNYYSGFRGAMRIQTALDISCNTVPIQLLECLGASNSYTTLKSMGFGSLVEQDKSLALAIGAVTYGVTPLEMASGYQTIANGGVWVEPTFFESVSYNGNTIYSASNRVARRVFSEETAAIITNLLVGVVEDEEGTAKTLKMNQAIAAKTGTTDDSYDKWLCCYTTEYVVATWFGNDNPSSINKTSASIHNHVRNVLNDIPKGKTEFTVPQTVGLVKVCNRTNCVATESCENTRIEVLNLTKQYVACDSCNKGFFENIVEDIQENLQEDEHPVVDAFGNFFSGLLGGNKNQEQTTAVETEYQEPQYEEEAIMPEESPIEQETVYIEDPLPEEAYQN